jgi:hypothetical protein
VLGKAEGGWFSRLEKKGKGKGRDSARPGEAGKWRILPGMEFSFPLPFLYPERDEVMSLLSWSSLVTKHTSTRQRS